MLYIKNYFKYLIDFVGVASRKDFWIPMGASLFLQCLLWGLSLVVPFFQVLALIVGLGLALPSISILVRRLHDTDRGAINLLWLFVPIIGMVVLLIFTLEKTKYFVK